MASGSLVTVVMPVRDGARFLRDAIGSVAAQSYRNWELVVVGAPSRDDSEAVARSFPFVRYVEQRGSGLWNAFNQGIAAGRGELLAFLSADDRWLPDKLRLQVEEMERRPELELLGGRVRFVRVEGEPLSPAFRPRLLEGDHASLCPEVLMVRAEVFERLGRFDESFALGADVEWLARARGRGAVVDVSPALMLLKRVHGSNLSTLASSAKPFNHDVLRIARAQLARRRG